MPTEWGRVVRADQPTVTFRPNLQGDQMTREVLEAQLLRLPNEERAHLARVLIDSLDDEPELDPSWLVEARRRAEELQSGVVATLPASEAFANARRRLLG